MVVRTESLESWTAEQWAQMLEMLLDRMRERLWVDLKVHKWGIQRDLQWGDCLAAQ